jgi:hypothetical protein
MDDLRTIGRALCRASIAVIIIIATLFIAAFVISPFIPNTGRGGSELVGAKRGLDNTIRETIMLIIWGLLISGFGVYVYARRNWNWGDALCTMLLTGAVTVFLVCGFSGVSYSEIFVNSHYENIIRFVLFKTLITVETGWLVGVFIGIVIKSRKSAK